MTAVTHKHVEHARKGVLDQVRVARTRLLAHVEGGDRNFDELRILLNQYIDLLTAADVLGGTTRIESASGA